jgi:hypothetical protein
MAMRAASARRALFDLAHLSSLSDEPGLALFVSPKTLYCLQNLANLDVTDLSRYAVEMLDDVWYVPVTAEDPEWTEALDVIEGVQTEVYQMPIYAYVDVVTQRVVTQSPAEGTYIVTYVVPEGELWELQGLACANIDRAQPVKIDTQDQADQTCLTLLQETPASATTWVTWQGKLVLKGLMKFRFVFYGTQPGDDCYTEIHVAKLVPL